MIVYKYLLPDRVDVLENASIRFTQPDALNDPFESFPNFSDLKKNVEEFIKTDFNQRFGGSVPDESLSWIMERVNDEITNIPRSVGERLVMLSLTKKRNNGLMWSHYTDSHKGLVIGFDSNCEFFQPKKGRTIYGLREVKYSKIRENAFTNDLFNEIEKEHEKFFFTKSIDWEYEKELRMYANPKTADKTFKLGGLDVYLFNFPQECVKRLL